MKNIVKFLTVIFILNTASIVAQTLQPGDGINLVFYNIKEKLQGQYFIQENNKIQLPYIGLINTIDKDFTSIRNEIINKYSKIYRNPEIDVQLLFRINVLGEVGQPGIFYANGYESLTDLLARAGGETNDADFDGIFIIRNNVKMEINVEEIFEDGKSINDIGIRSGDKIYVPRAWWVTARDASVIISGVAVLVAIAGLFTK